MLSLCHCPGRKSSSSAHSQVPPSLACPPRTLYPSCLLFFTASLLEWKAVCRPGLLSKGTPPLCCPPPTFLFPQHSSSRAHLLSLALALQGTKCLSHKVSAQHMVILYLPPGVRSLEEENHFRVALSRFQPSTPPTALLPLLHTH